MRTPLIVSVVLLAVLLGGCSSPGASSVKTPEPQASSSASRSGPAHPPAKLAAGQQRLMLRGLAVTLATAKEPAPKRGFEHLSVSTTVLNTTDVTITIGPRSAPEVFDARGVLLSYANAGGTMSADHGPYWGLGGPYPGTPQNSDFAPGGTLQVTLFGDVPESAGRLRVRWTLDPSRVASFTVPD